MQEVGRRVTIVTQYDDDTSDKANKNEDDELYLAM